MKKIIEKLRPFIKKILQNKFIEKLKKDKKNIYLVFVLCLVFAAIDAVFLLRLQSNSLKTLGPKISAVKKDLEAFRKEYAAMEKSKKEQATGKPLEVKKIVLEGEVYNFIEQISVLANHNDIQVLQIKPIKISDKVKAAKGKTKGKAKGKVTAKEKQSLPPYGISLEVECSYPQITAFIKSLETAPEFIAIEEILVSQSGKNYLKQKAELILKTYVKKGK